MRIGLVLGGGGAKGAYEVGVYKALWELGIRHFHAIAGTSIGALNAILFASKTPDESAQIWRSMAVPIERSITFNQTVFAIVSYVLLVALPFCLVPISLLITLWVGHGLDLDESISDPGRWCCHFLITTSVMGVAQTGMSRWREKRAPTVLISDNTFFFCTTVALAAILGMGIGYAVQILFLLNLTISVRIKVLGSYALLILLAALIWMPIAALRRALLDKIRDQGLADSSTLKQMITALLITPIESWRSGSIYVTVAKDSLYYDPTQELVSPRGRLRGWHVREWLPEYADITKMSWELCQKVLFASASIPYAFPAWVPDGSGDHCDGGVADNLPIFPIVNNGGCDLVIVVALNPEEARRLKHLQDHLDCLWAKCFVAAHTARTDELYCKFGQSYKKHIPGRPIVGQTKIVCVTPKQALPRLNLPVFRFLGGTLNFKTSAVERWMEQGYIDALHGLRPIVEP